MRRAALLSCCAWLATTLIPMPARTAERAELKSTRQEPALVSADELQYDQDRGLVIARGHVEISQQNQILLADTVTYNQGTDTVTASGHVSLLEPTGDVVFGDFVELHDDMRDGFIKDVRILLSDRSRLAGNTARRADAVRTILRRGVYSPCELCAKDPTKPPVWQIKADEIIQDKKLQLVEYHDAVMEIEGVPIFYTPYFSHPDPSVKRQSGLLPITVGSDTSNGYRVSVPYYFVLGPDKDAIFRPIFTTEGGTIFDGQYRQRFGSGPLQLDGSVAVNSNLISPSTATELATKKSATRGHFFGSGVFDLSDDWRVGFDAQRASDQSYLARYHFPYTPNYLTSKFYAEHFGSNSYTNITAYSFQSLTPGLPDAGEPFALPSATYDYTTDPDSIGGRWQFTGNAVNIARREGLDMRRASAGTGWSLPFTGPLGEVYHFAATARADGYYSNNIIPYPYLTEPENTFGTRFFPQASLKVQWPWIRRGNANTMLIEPIVAAVAAPSGENPSRIPNEDSQGFEFDETSLFVPNRFPGYDRVDSGQRVDYGLHGGIYNDVIGSTQFLVGQSYAFERNSAFAPGSGLDSHRSDVVGRTVVSPNKYLDVFYRFRLDKTDLEMRRQEAGVAVGPTNLRVGASYIDVNEIPGLTSIPQAHQLSGNISANLTPFWSVALHDTRNFSSGGATISSGVSLTYRDDCISVTGTLSQSGISYADVRPGTSFLLTFVFRDLGEIGVKSGG